MHRIFAGLAAWVAIGFAAEFALGLAVSRAVVRGDASAAQSLFTWHMLGGVFLGTLVAVLHVMTMFHFIGSGRELKEAAEVLGGDAGLVERVRRFKVQTFPWATFAPLVTGASVILGGMAHMMKSSGWGWLHWALGLAALALNLAAFPVEYRALKTNLELIQEVDFRLRQDAIPPLRERPRA